MRDFFKIKDVFKTRNLVIMAMLLALEIVLSQFTIYLTPQLQLTSFTFLPNAIVSCLFGPWAGIIFGILGDAASFFAKPVGFYFPGYALSAVVSNLIYAALMYKGKLEWWRIALARLLILIFVTLGINFIWMQMLYGQPAAKFFNGLRIAKNLIQLPFQVILIMLFGQLMKRLENGTFRTGKS